MMTLIIVLLGLHVLAGVFWAGSTFALALSGPDAASRLFGAQMLAATVSVLAGLGLWGILHKGPPGGMEKALALGALCALAAAGVQGALRRSKPPLAQKIAAGLLAVTVITMTLARYVP
jgi:hypothetical protein